MDDVDTTAMPPATSLHASLRKATAADHAALDAHPLLQPLTHDHLTLDQYRLALHALYPPQAQLEQAILVSLPRLAPDFPWQGRCDALRADLAALDLPVPARPPELEVAIALPLLLGWLYVTEGSRLGSALIEQHVRRALGPDVPRAFLLAAGPGRHWPHFWSFAERHCTTAPERALARQGAAQAFTLYRRQLDHALAVGLSR